MKGERPAKGWSPVLSIAQSTLNKTRLEFRTATFGSQRFTYYPDWATKLELIFRLCDLKEGERASLIDRALNLSKDEFDAMVVALYSLGPSGYRDFIPAYSRLVGAWID